MNFSESSLRINLIKSIADKLYKEDWTIIDLTLRQFNFPWTDQWPGDSYEYVIDMIQDGDIQGLKQLARHLEIEISADSFEESHKIQEIDLEKLIKDIEKQKSLMISVSTGGPRIQKVNKDYSDRRSRILIRLDRLGVGDPNPHNDLWMWYGKWSDGSMPTYRSRRKYITDLYQPLIDNLILGKERGIIDVHIEPTGWIRVDRSIEKIMRELSHAKDEEDFQTIGLLCREAIISLAQAVYDPIIHSSINGVNLSDTDAKRMLESYIASTLPGSSNEELRKYAKDAYNLAVVLQHKRTANLQIAALCVEATRSLINIIKIISDQ